MRPLAHGKPPLAKPFVPGGKKANGLGLGLVTVALIMIGGCKLNAREVKFYLLQPGSRSEALAAVTESASPALIGLGPVEMPAYLDRPQIVTGNPGAELQLAEYHRWAEPLRDTITRVLAENLSLSMPASHILAFPWNRAVNPDFQVVVKVVRFHVDANGNSELKADWSILRQNKPVLIKEFQTRTVAAGTDYEAKVAAQSQALARFGKEIAAALKTAAETRQGMP
jgi:uncharacterized lipoprotein YmbA